MLRYYTINFELATAEVDIERTHRIRKPRDVGQKSRPIIVKFVRYNDRKNVFNTACDKNGRILILDADLNDTNFLLINFYKSNLEFEQLSTFFSLQKLLGKFDDYSKKIIAFESDFSLIFDQKFNPSGRKTVLK